MSRLERLVLWLVAAAVMVPGISQAQAPGDGAATPANVWTFSTDSSSNLVIQDLPSFLTDVQGSIVGVPFCLQYAAPCPSDSVRTRRKYTLRGGGSKGSEWRLELGDMVYPQGGMMLPMIANITGDKGTVQVMTSPGPWTIDLSRIPAAELKAGEGKKWKVNFLLDQAEAGAGCWIEVQCPPRPR